MGGLSSTWNFLKGQFFGDSYWDGLANTFTLGTYGGIQILNGVAGLASNISNYTANDYAYGAGFLTEKAFEAVVLRKMSQANVSWSGVSRNASGNFKFSLKAHWPNDNFMIRLERGHRSPYLNTKIPYLGEQYNGFNTHFNIQKIGSYNYHIPINPLKWKYYGSK